MVKISFGLLKPKNVEKEDTGVNNKLSSVFSKPEHSSKENIKKELITELSFSSNKIDNKEDDLNKYVIPCKNSLKNLKDVSVNYIPQKKVTEELKYGLNILYESNYKKKEPGFSESDIKDDKNVDGYKDNINNKDDNLESNKRLLEDTTQHCDSNNKDENVARKIIEELEKKKLREKLFGGQVDLIDLCSKTVPILLRSKKNRIEFEKKYFKLENYRSDSDDTNTSNKDNNIKDENNNNNTSKENERETMDIKNLLDVKMDQYENVPVENFGLAMLLGMGYDPKKNNIEPKVYKKRVFERAGLGADSVMKTNMESLMDANLMSKLKKNRIYNIVDDTTTVSNWALPNIVVKITDKNHEYYRNKGIVKSIDKNMVNLIIQGKEIQINYKYLETVVSIESKICKVVRRIPNIKKKDYIQIGTLVKLMDINEYNAKIIYEDQELIVSLDSISEYKE